MDKKNYVALHNHSDYSALDGYGTIDEYLQAAKDKGMIGIGLSDHGTASGLYKFITRAQKKGLIPVPGVEFYVAPENKKGAKVQGPIYYGPGGKKAPNYDVSNGAYTHLTVFAYNNKGLENLFKLTSISWQPENYYFKPRIDTNMLAQYSEGLIATTGCPSSEISKRFLLGQDDKAYEYATRMKSIFGENYYVEVMDHSMESEELERIIAPKLIKMAEDLNIQPILTNDSHYAFKGDHKPHERILAVSTRSTMDVAPYHEGGKRFAFSTPEYHVKSYDEMLEIFPGDFGERALANTIKVTEQCKDIKLSYDPRLRPEIEIPEGKTPATYFQDLIFEGFKKKRGGASKEIQAESVARIKNEFEVIHSNDFISYFLVVHDYISFAHRKGIGIGAGRGSVGGSEIAYVLDISNTDPIRFNLLFERFLSPGRGSQYQIDYVTGESEDIAVSDKKHLYSNVDEGKVVYVHELNPGDLVNHDGDKKVIKDVFVKVPGSAPDVDTDFHTEGREEVVQYCVEKYGKENVANIITFGTFKAKRAFKAMSTIYKIPFSAANAASSLIPGGPGAEVSLKEILDPTSPRYNEGADFREATEGEMFEEVLENAEKLDGRIFETGIHPCFAKGTLIKTDVGYKSIEKIIVGDNVLTHKNSYNKVVEVMSNNSSDLYELLTANSLPLQVTGSHPMYVREVVKNKSTQKGLSARYLLEPTWKNVDKLSIENDLIGIPVNGNSIIPSLPYDLPFESENFWWFIGRYLGDGWYEEFESKRNKKRTDGETYVYTSITKKICISVGKEDPTKQELIDKISSLFNIRMETSGKTADKIYISPSKYPDLFNFLKMFGKYAHGKRVPEEVLNLPVELLSMFLDGYISADGTSPVDKTFVFSTISKELFLGISAIVNKVYNKHCTVVINKREGTTMIIEGREVNVRDRYIGRFTTEKRLKERSFYEDGFLWVHISKLNKLEMSDIEVHNLSVIDDNSYTVNNLIAHNCGIIISKEPIAGIVPTQVRQDDGKVLTQWEYPELESLGLIKMDFLGLELINTIQQSLENIKLTNDSAVNKKHIREVPNMRDLINGEMDDAETYKMLQEGNSVGIFQLGSPGVRELLKRAKPTKFMDVATITALYRPGPMSMNSHTEWADRNNSSGEIITIDEKLKGTVVEKILAETAGVLVFQESLMQIAIQYAGMTPYESDLLRKAMGKKKIDLMASLHPKFVTGAVEKGSTKELAEKVWGTMEGFAAYGFNKSHSVSYAINIYQAMYLKTHYPSEFMAAVIQQGLGDPKKLKPYIQEAKRMNLRIGAVDINTSQVQPSSTGVAKTNGFDIVFGFGGVRNVNETLASAIVEERNESGPYTSVANFVKRLSKKVQITGAPLAKLALAGAFDQFGVSREIVSEKAKMLIDAGAKQANKGVSLFDMLGGSSAAANDIAENIELKGKDFDYNDKIKAEANTIGMFVSGHPISNLGHMARSLKPTRLNTLLKSGGSKEVFTVLGTITDVKMKTNKAGNKSIAVLIDDGEETAASFLPKTVVQAVEKGMELARIKKAQDSGTEVKETKNSIKLKEVMEDNSIVAIDSIELNHPYAFKVKTRGWGESVNISVVDIIKLHTAPDGSLPYEVKGNNATAKGILALAKKHKDKNGSYVKVNYPDGHSKLLDVKVKLDLDFIMNMEKLVGRENIVTEGI